MADTDKPQRHVTEWTPAHLRRMLLDPRYEPPPLWLKWADAERAESRGVQIRRYFDASINGPLVDKTYLGWLKNRAGHEAQLMDAVADFKAMRAHVVGLYKKTNAATFASNTMTITTQWAGLSVSDWLTLLPQERCPFVARSAALLSLVRGILRALKPFHAQGFVHGDLLLHNILVPADMQAHGQGLLRIDKLKVLDLELSYSPVDSLTLPTGARLPPRQASYFSDAQGNLLPIHPLVHSQWLLPGEWANPALPHFTRYYSADEAKARLRAIDWGVDLCTFGLCLGQLLHHCNFADEDDNPGAANMLHSLVHELQAHDQLADPAQGQQNPRPGLPHQAWMDRIDELLGPHDSEAAVGFVLPTEAELGHASSLAGPQNTGTLLSRSQMSLLHRQQGAAKGPSVAPAPAPRVAPEAAAPPAVVQPFLHEAEAADFHSYRHIGQVAMRHVCRDGGPCAGNVRLGQSLPYFDQGALLAVG